MDPEGKVELGPGRRSVFTADLDDGNGGIFIADPPGPITEVALTGDPAPGTGAGTFDSFGTIRAAGRRVLFAASVTGGSASTGLYLWNDGALSKIAVDGDATPVGGTFPSLFLDPQFGAIALSGARAAFVADVTGGSADGGLFLFNRGQLSPIVLVGDATPLGGTFRAFDEEPISLFGRSAVFDAFLDGAGAFAGLFSATP